MKSVVRKDRLHFVGVSLFNVSWLSCQCTKAIYLMIFCTHFYFLVRHNIEFNCYTAVDECHNHFFVLTFTFYCYTIWNSFVLMLLWMSACLIFFVSTSSLEPLPPKHVTSKYSFFSLQIRSFSKFLLFSTFLTYVTICVADQMQKCHQVASERLHCWWKGLEA